MSYADPPKTTPGTRRGRPHGHSEPVTVVSISMDPATLRDIDEESLRNGRTRSAWVRWVLRSYIQLRRDEREAAKEEREQSASFDAVAKDPTRGGRFDPAQTGGANWGCPNPSCIAHDSKGEHCALVSGWLVCHQCGTPRPAVSGD